MKRTITTLSLALALTIGLFAQAAPAQQSKPEHFSKQQLNNLIATAKTPAEHELSITRQKRWITTPRQSNTNRWLPRTRPTPAYLVRRTRLAPSVIANTL